MRWPSVWLAACSCVVLVAACGGSSAPRLPSEYAEPAALQADEAVTLLAGRSTCTARRLLLRMQKEAISAVNADRIPPELQEGLLSRINDIVGVVGCGPPIAVTPTPTARAKALAAWIRGHS